MDRVDVLSVKQDRVGGVKKSPLGFVGRSNWDFKCKVGGFDGMAVVAVLYGFHFDHKCKELR